MAQALERAGDHTTNLAEELYSLIEGRSLRHVPKKKASSVTPRTNSSFINKRKYSQQHSASHRAHYPF